MVYAADREEYEGMKRFCMKQMPLCSIVAFAAVLWVCYSYINIAKYRLFSVTSFGWGTFYDFAKTGFFNCFLAISDACPELGLFHVFKPFIFILSALFSLIPSVHMFFILCPLLLCASAVVMYYVAMPIVYDRWLAGAFAISFLLNPIVVSGSMLGFVMAIFGEFFLLLALYAYEKKNDVLFYWCALLAGFVDVGIVGMFLCFGVGLHLLRPQRKKMATRLVVVSVLWILIAIAGAALYLAMCKKAFPTCILHMHHCGNTFGDIVAYMVHKPIAIAANVFDNKHNFLLTLFGNVPNVLCVLSPLYCMALLPEIMYVLVRNQHASGQFYLLPFIFVGAMHGVQKLILLCKGSAVLQRRCVRVLAILIVIISSVKWFFGMYANDFLRSVGPAPFTRDFTLTRYADTMHARIGRDIIASLPERASYLTSPAIANHIRRPQELGLFSAYFLRVDYPWIYVVLDLTANDFYQVTPDDYFSHLKEFLTTDYGVVRYEDGWLLLKRGYEQAHNAAVLADVVALESTYAHDIP